VISVARALPWTNLLAAIGAERFAEVRSALERDGVDPLDRDAFLLHRAVAALYRDLVPEEGAADAVNAYGTLLHMLYLTWLEHPAVAYHQLAERKYWAQRGPAEPHEPIDGVFRFERGGVLELQAVLGVHDFGEGFSTIEAAVPLPLSEPGPRDDGTAAFAPLMVAGDRAGLHSVVNAAELAWLVRASVSP
jgi:hypothetical protein